MQPAESTEHTENISNPSELVSQREIITISDRGSCYHGEIREGIEKWARGSGLCKCKHI